jgi:hypothetical protein
MMSLERMHQSAVAVRMFERYLDRCDLVMRLIFGVEGSETVELRSRLFDAAPTVAAKMGIIHIEPLYIVAEYLGIDESDPSFLDKERGYSALAQNEGWNNK